MFGYTFVKEDHLMCLEKSNEWLENENNNLIQNLSNLHAELEVAQKQVAKLQTHLREAKEANVTKQLTDRDLLYSKEVKQIAYAIFHHYAERSMESSVIKKEEKKYQQTYRQYVQHLQKLLK